MPIKAYAAMTAGKSLEPFTYQPGKLGPHEVEITITHCGLCHSDIHMIDNDWGITQFPLVPGHEIVGTISDLGPEVAHVAKGDRVGVGWQAGSCFRCEWCAQGEETFCPENRGTIVGRHGGFGDAVRCDGRFVFRIPEGLDSAAAAPLLCGGITVYSPLLETARPASRVGILGIGGLGHFALQFANAFGCEVTAFSMTPEKEKEAKKFGAHHFVVSTDKGRMEKAAGSFDVLLSTVTAKMDWAAWMGLLRPKGALVFVGAAPGLLDVPAMSLVLGNKSVRGSAIGNRTRIREMLSFAARHGIQAQIEVLPMSDVNKAIAKVKENKARYRMVLENKGR